MTTQTPASALDPTAPAVRLRADSRAVIYAAAALVALLGITSLIASFQGLLAVAGWAMLPPTLRWTVPVALDGAILVYTLVALVRRARHESTRLAWTAVGLGTALSAAANALHVIVGDVDPLAVGWVRAVGAGVAGLAPILAAVAIHALADLAIAPPVKRTRRRAARASAPARAAASAPSVPARPVAVPTPTTEPTPAPRRVAGAQARQQALALHREGMSQRAIAAQLGVGKTTIGRWLEAELTAA